MDFFKRELSDPVNTYQDSRKEFQQIYLELLEHQRNLLDKINQNSEFDEEIIRKYQFLVDMEEYKVREKFSQES